MNAKQSIKLPLDHVYHWEAAKANDIYMTQPMGEGEISEFSWRRAVNEARRMASYLRSLDLPPQSHIAIMSKNCAHWIMSDWAIWMAGHVSVPLYPTLNADTVRYILEHSDARLLFVGKLDDWDEMKGGVPDDLPCVAYPLSPQTDYPQWDQLILEHAPLTENTQRDAEELATIVYTSGSTGEPKGVMLSFYALAVASEGICIQLGVRSTDRMLSYLPLAHVFERFAVEQASLQCGFSLFFAESLDTFMVDLQRARPTVFLAVPRIWMKFQLGIFQKLPARKLDRLLRIPLLSSFIKKKVLVGLGLEHCRFAGSGSAPLPEDLMRWYRRLGLELLEGYGMSENFGYSHLSKKGRTRIGYVGEPLPGVEVRISDQGEVQVKSPANMMGYYKEDDKTRETLTEDGYVMTGDKGEIDEKGRLKLTGRLKEIFKTSKGKYVAPAPIENKLAAHPSIELVCVSGADCPQPYGLVVLSEEAMQKRSDEHFRQELESSFCSLLDKVNSSLDHHEQLQFLTIVKDSWTIENGFLTPTMKIKRNVIESTYRPEQDNWYQSKAAIIWQ